MMTNPHDIYWGVDANDEVSTTLTHSKKRKIVSDTKNKQNEDYKYHSPLIYTVGKEVHFSTGVNKLSIELLIRQMSDIMEKFYKHHDDTDNLTITYVVDSPGGSVHSCLKFIDFLGLSKNKYPNLKFVSIVSGFAASAGSVMACVADERYMTKYSCAMIHELSSGTSGRYTQMESYSYSLKELHNTLIDIYVKHSKLTREELELKMKSDKWYMAEQYKLDGFVDDIK
jgi:ATP-dependent protease ClpP protease subunit